MTADWKMLEVSKCPFCFPNYLTTLIRINLTTKNALYVVNLFLDPVGKEQAPVTSEGMNKTIERYLAEYARKHLGKPRGDIGNGPPRSPSYFHAKLKPSI